LQNSSGNYIEIPVSKEILENAVRILQHHTTTLIKVAKDYSGAEKSIHIGSGTFVQIEDAYGIITAQHVAKQLDGPCHLGLTIDTAYHRYLIPKDHLGVFELAMPVTEEWGPDLAFIGIPAAEVGTIRASMSFYNLSSHRQEQIQNPRLIDTGAWVLCGAPEVTVKSEGPKRGYRKALAFEHFACEGLLINEMTRDAFDYVEMPIDHSLYTKTPPTFKGMSGGGLWQLLIEQNSAGEVRVKSFVLSGVIFYQTELIDNKRSVRCHFRKSLYQYGYAEIVKRLREAVND